MDAISSYHPFYCVRVVLLTLLTSFSSFSISFAHIRDMQIKSFNDSIIYIDGFEFSQTGGRLELNVSNIYISISDRSNNLNFSEIGFFLYHRRNFSKESCPVGSYDVFKRVQTFDKLGFGGDSINENHFEVVLSEFVPVHPKYYLFFVSCIPDERAISMYVQYAMYNLLHDGEHRSFLSPSELLELRSLFVFISIYLLLSWFCLIYHVLSDKRRRRIFRIHKFMFVVLLMRVFSLFCKCLNKYYIMSTGCSHCWAPIVLIVISDLLSRVPQGALLILIASGWSYIKTSLSFMDKVLLITVIHFDVVVVIAFAVIDYGRPESGFKFVYDITTTFCCFIPVRLAAQVSLKYLRQGGLAAEGKAADCLFKIKLLRCFLLFVYLFYLIVQFPQILMGVLEILDRRPNFLLSLVSEELVTVVFYVLLGYKFRPSVLKLKVPVSDDVEKDAAKVHAIPAEFDPFDLFGDSV